jgi:hypothetical protein
MGREGSGRLLVPPLLLAAAGLISFAVSPHLRARADSARQQPSSQVPVNPAAKPPNGPGSIPLTLPKGKKLILRDGSFQLVREYTRQGDRVRYWSVERSAWEEIPASLVDWDATQKAEAEQQANDKELAQKIKASQLKALTAGIDSDRSLEIRPGVILPDEAGLYALDGLKVSTMEQDLAVSRMNKGREVARIASGVGPLISSRHEIEIAGKRAKLRIGASEPEFYFRPVDGRDPDFSLLQLEVYDGKRKIESMSTNIVGMSKYKNRQVSLLGWDAARGVKRFTVEQKLEPGEYAIVENRPDGEVDLYIWDFGVDPGQ